MTRHDPTPLPISQKRTGRLFFLTPGEPELLHRCPCADLRSPAFEFGRYNNGRVALRVARIGQKRVEFCPTCLPQADAKTRA